MLRKILSFSQITNHKGGLIGKEIEIVLHYWIINRVITITKDNYAANDLAVKYVKIIYDHLWQWKIGLKSVLNMRRLKVEGL